jgi:hypothetical protein
MEQQVRYRIRAHPDLARLPSTPVVRLDLTLATGAVVRMAPDCRCAESAS